MHCCGFLLSSFLKTSQLPLISAVCEASQPASSDYNGQIDFLPWRFYHQHRNADFVAVTTQSMFPQQTAILLQGLQLFVKTISNYENRFWVLEAIYQGCLQYLKTVMDFTLTHKVRIEEHKNKLAIVWFIQ